MLVAVLPTVLLITTVGTTTATVVRTDCPRSPSLSVGPLFFYPGLSSLGSNWSGSRMAGGGVEVKN